MFKILIFFSNNIDDRLTNSNFRTNFLSSWIRIHSRILNAESGCGCGSATLFKTASVKKLTNYANFSESCWCSQAQILLVEKNIVSC
jgi:hypothetical protein